MSAENSNFTSLNSVNSSKIAATKMENEVDTKEKDTTSEQDIVNYLVSTFSDGNLPPIGVVIASINSAHSNIDAGACYERAANLIEQKNNSRNIYKQKEDSVEKNQCASGLFNKTMLVVDMAKSTKTEKKNDHNDLNNDELSTGDSASAQGGD